jgi:hypothetical protein
VLAAVDEMRAAVPVVRADALVASMVLGTMLNLAVFGVGRWVAWSVRHRRLVAELAAAERGRVARELTTSWRIRSA